MGEEGDQSLLKGFVGICTPFDGLTLDRYGNKYMWGYYHRQLGSYLTTLSMKHTEELRPLEKRLGCTIEEFCKRRPTYGQFDKAITAPTYGYSTVDDYYRKTSGILKIGTITTPTLFINAFDDPIVWYYVPNLLVMKSHHTMNV